MFIRPFLPLPTTQCDGLGANYTPGEWKIRCSIVVYCMAVQSVIGWILFMFFAGVGLFCAPIDWMHQFIGRPKSIITKSEFINRARTIAQRAKELQSLSDMLKRQVRGRAWPRRFSVSLAIDGIRMVYYCLVCSSEDELFHPVPALTVLQCMSCMPFTSGVRYCPWLRRCLALVRCLTVYSLPPPKPGPAVAQRRQEPAVARQLQAPADGAVPTGGGRVPAGPRVPAGGLQMNDELISLFPNHCFQTLDANETNDGGGRVPAGQSLPADDLETETLSLWIASLYVILNRLSVMFFSHYAHVGCNATMQPRACVSTAGIFARARPA